jgi:uncharacterized membrane protein
MRIGTRVYGAAAALAGVVGFAFGEAFLAGRPPHDQHLPHMLVVWGGDALLLVAGAAVLIGRRFAACGAIALAVFFALSAFLQQGPALVSQAGVWVTWQGLAEPLAMGFGGVIAWSLLGDPHSPRRTRAASVAQRGLGLCLLVFGVSHFVYLKYTAALVPAWLPPSQTAWACATGAAHIAAGLAFLSGVQARLAARLLTGMWVVFGLLVHLPAVAHAPRDPEAWTEHGINLLLVGAAWCLADRLGLAKAADAPLFTQHPPQKP